MSWIEYKNMSPKTVYRSNETTEDEIVKDLTLVINECIKNKEKDLASNCNTIFLFTNATNGYLELYFYDVENMEPEGHSLYMLELPALSDDHKDNADNFDKMTKQCSMLFLQTEYGKELKSDIEFSFMNEFYEVVKL